MRLTLSREATMAWETTKDCEREGSQDDANEFARGEKLTAEGEKEAEQRQREVCARESKVVSFRSSFRLICPTRKRQQALRRFQGPAPAPPTPSRSSRHSALLLAERPSPPLPCLASSPFRAAAPSSPTNPRPPFRRSVVKGREVIWGRDRRWSGDIGGGCEAVEVCCSPLKRKQVDGRGNSYSENCE